MWARGVEKQIWSTGGWGETRIDRGGGNKDRRGEGNKHWNKDRPGGEETNFETRIDRGGGINTLDTPNIKFSFTFTPRGTNPKTPRNQQPTNQKYICLAAEQRGEREKQKNLSYHDPQIRILPTRCVCVCAWGEEFTCSKNFSRKSNKNFSLSHTKILYRIQKNSLVHTKSANKLSRANPQQSYIKKKKTLSSYKFGGYQQNSLSHTNKIHNNVKKLNNDFRKKRPLFPAPPARSPYSGFLIIIICLIPFPLLKKIYLYKTPPE